MDRNCDYSGPDRGSSNGPASNPSSASDERPLKSPLKTRSQSLYTMGCNERHPLLNQNAFEQAASSDALSPHNRLSILPRLNQISIRNRKLNTLLLEAVKSQDMLQIEKLINAGASSNATCVLDGLSACHLAALYNNDALKLLLNLGAEKQRWDRFGRTPLHLAAWAGNVKQVAILLGFPEDLQEQIAVEEMSLDTEEEVMKLRQHVKEIVNVRCGSNTASTPLPKEWRDSSTDHDCKEFEKTLPFFQPGWTPLLAASARARPHCVRLLLAAGADISARDFLSRTSLDVAGSAHYAGQTIVAQDFIEVVTLLRHVHCKKIAFKNRQNLGSPLHTAVELNCLEAVRMLLEVGLPLSSFNRAGQTPLHLCVKKKHKEQLQVLASSSNSSNAPSLAIETRDRDGRPVLHAAVLNNWLVGVRVALEAGASITSKDYDGETPIHLAAVQGNLDILIEILNVSNQNKAIDTLNSKNETALFKAVINGHIECVKKILKEGASISYTLPNGVNVFHIAAEKGYAKLLEILLDHDYKITRGMINFLTAEDRKGFGPIHFAVIANHFECVKILLSRNAYVNLRTSYGIHKSSTPLHLAAIKNRVEIAKFIIKFDATTVYTVDDMGWSPLHVASHHGSRDVIALLLKEGADLSSHTNGPKNTKATSIEIIMNNISKPTKFMEEIFDMYIYTNNKNIQDPNCKVTVKFEVLTPKKHSMEQMKVIEALLKTGNRYDQRRLLLHPLLESFLYLRWKALLPFFYMMIAIYGIFVLALTMYIMAVFFFKDKDIVSPMVLDATCWSFVVYATVCLIISQEILYMTVSSRYFLQLETWVKIGSICLAVILPYSVTQMSLTGIEWPRHVATVALLLSWLEMTYLLSRFPDWGYYVLMFAKVSSNVLKILLTFAFLVVGFSLSFMVQFHSQIPFEDPWAALVKTMVMMTSEFDYDDLVEKDSKKDIKKVATSLLTVRLIFVAFLILASIVLMNLMVGVAVNDLHNLQVLGNVRRLAKQVEFIGSLENLVQNSFIKKILPNKLNSKFRNRKKVLRAITLKPSDPSASKYYKALPTRIREDIFEKAQRQKKLVDEELGTKIYKKILDEIHQATVKKNKKRDGLISAVHPKDIEECDDLKAAVTNMTSSVTNMEYNIKQLAQDTQASIKNLNIKINILLDRFGSETKTNHFTNN